MSENKRDSYRSERHIFAIKFLPSKSKGFTNVILWRCKYADRFVRLKVSIHIKIIFESFALFKQYKQISLI